MEITDLILVEVGIMVLIKGEVGSPWFCCWFLLWGYWEWWEVFCCWFLFLVSLMSFGGEVVRWWTVCGMFGACGGGVGLWGC